MNLMKDQFDQNIQGMRDELNVDLHRISDEKKEQEESLKIWKKDVVELKSKVKEVRDTDLIELKKA